MMETTNDNIRQLMDMLDHPDEYTEQEIRDIINQQMWMPLGRGSIKGSSPSSRALTG